MNARTDAQIRIFKQHPTFSLFISPGNVILFEKPYETYASCFIIDSKRLETKFTFSVFGSNVSNTRKSVSSDIQTLEVG